jgi:hypothetical protein
MAGGVSGAASGGVLGLCLALLLQQFGYFVFATLEETLIILVLFIFVFAVVFGVVGRMLKSSAIRRAQKDAAVNQTPPGGAPPPSGSAPETSPPTSGGTPPPAS